MDVRKKKLLIAALFATAVLAIGAPAKAQEAPPGCQSGTPAGAPGGCDTDNVNVLPGRGGSGGGGHSGGSSSQSSAVSSSSVTSVRSQDVGDVVYEGAAPPVGTGAASVFPPPTVTPMFLTNDAYVAAPAVIPAVVPAELPVASPQPVE